MELLAPGALWWLLALAVLLLLPRIRRPRSRRAVAAPHLWMRSPADERQRPLIRFRRHLAVLVQALAILALVAAIARPVIFLGGRTLAVVIDVSASMGARQEGRLRLDAARAAVLEEIGRMPWGSRVRVLAAGSSVEDLGEFGSTSPALRTALGRVEPQPSGADLDSAIATARALADGQVLVVSDRPAMPLADVRWRQVGTTAANLAVTTFAIRPLPESPFDAELVAGVTNYSDAPVTADLVISGAAGPLVREPVTLAARESRTIALQTAASNETFTASINHEDGFPADNSRTATLPARRTRVAFAGQPSRFTRAAVDVNPRLEVVAEPARADVVIAAGDAAASGNVLYLRARDTRVLDPRHPVATAVAPHPVRADAIVEPSRRVLRLGVDDEDARLVRDTTFPLLIAAGVHWLAGDAETNEPAIPSDESDLTVTPSPVPSAAGTQEVERRGRPLALMVFCIVAALLFIAIDWFVTGRRAHLARRVLVVRGAVVIALLAAAVGVRMPWGEAPASIVFAFDRSLSIGPVAQADGARTVETFASRMRGGDQAAVVAFGADTVVDQPLAPRAPRPLPESDLARGGTNIEQALRVSRALLPGSGTQRIVLMTDGHATAGDPARELAAAAQAGVAVDVVPLRNPRRGAARLVAISAPDRVASGDAFDVTVVVAGRPGTRASVTVLRDGGPIHTATGELDATGQALVTARDRADTAGVVTYTAAVDGHNATDVGAAVTVVRSPSILYVSDAPVSLTGGDMRIEQRRAPEIPQSATALAQYTAVVLDDVQADGIAPGSLDALREFVTRQGGGLVLRGTPRTIGPAGYPQTPLDALLPVDFRGRGGSRGAELAVVVAFDKSGSMEDRAGDTSKIELARRAALAVHDVLAAGDALGVIAFDADAVPALPLGARGPADFLREKLRTIVPSGPTRIAPAIRLARGWLEKSSATRRRILLISDGRSNAADAAEVLSLVSDKRIPLTIVAAGDDADRAFFRELAATTGADVHVADNLSRLPAIAAREAAKASGRSIVAEAFQARAAAVHPILGDTAAASLPHFNGYVAAAARPAADVVLESHLGDPVLATRRAGLGRVVVVTSADVAADSRARWPSIWTNAIRWASRPQHDGVRAWFEGASIEVDVLDAARRFVNGLTGTATIRGPGGIDVVAPMRQTAPGRYSAPVFLDEAGTHVVSIDLTSGDGRMNYAVVHGIFRGVAAEVTRADADMEALAALARAGGGSVLDGTTSPFDQPRGAGAVDLSSAAAQLALALLLAELLLRRL